MSDPFRLRVLKAVTTQIKTVRPANGYTIDLSNYTDDAGRTMTRVFRGRVVFGDNDPLPLIAVLEDPRAIESNEAAGSPKSMNQLRLLIQGFVRDQKVNALDPAYHASANVIAALAKAKDEQFNILGMAGRVTHMSIGSPVHRPDDEISDTAYFMFGLTLTLAEDLETPFA